MGKMRGFVYSLDMVFALSLFVIIVTAILFLQGTGSNVHEASAILLASDIISALDKEGVLETLNTSFISEELNSNLPNNLNMSVTLHVYGTDLELEENKQVNTDLAGDYYRGKWLFIVGNITDVDKFIVAEYKVGFA